MPQEYVRRLLDYDPETGTLVWRVKKQKDSAYYENGKSIRLVVKIDGKSYPATNVVWLWMTGKWPAYGWIIDHRNRRPHDMRWDNLRLLPSERNPWNTSRRWDNTSGYTGVSWHPDNGSFVAYISVNKKRFHLGYFKTAEEAHEAYKAAVLKYRGEEFVV